ncbi:MAG: DUF2721 domain-containing protein [Bryobacter sp.]|nr:DUF2721 domain-containing protein [Bryobacter sp.]
MNPILGLPGLFNFQSLTSLFQNLSSALQVLTAMLTPALLLSACGSFIISTSNRLGRVVDRVRKLSDRMEELMHNPPDIELIAERSAMIEKHLELQSKRASLLMRTLVALYIASGLFVLTSVSIGVVAIISVHWSWIPVVFGIGGAIMMLVAAIRLVKEAHLALDGLHDETAFLQKLAAIHTQRAQSSLD